jgi:hypothetical protein
MFTISFSRTLGNRVTDDRLTCPLGRSDQVVMRAAAEPNGLVGLQEPLLHRKQTERTERDRVICRSNSPAIHLLSPA